MINEFKNEYAFLSNFYDSKIKFEAFNNEYKAKTVEHAYQALKCDHILQFEQVLNASTPGKAKVLGKTISLRKDWEEIKIFLMYELLKMRY